MRIIVIGGGIAGISCVEYLLEHHSPTEEKLDITLISASEVLKVCCLPLFFHLFLPSSSSSLNILSFSICLSLRPLGAFGGSRGTLKTLGLRSIHLGTIWPRRRSKQMPPIVPLLSCMISSPTWIPPQRQDLCSLPR